MIAHDGASVLLVGVDGHGLGFAEPEEHVSHGVVEYEEADEDDERQPEVAGVEAEPGEDLVASLFDASGAGAIVGDVQTRLPAGSSGEIVDGEAHVRPVQVTQVFQPRNPHGDGVLVDVKATDEDEDDGDGRGDGKCHLFVGADRRDADAESLGGQAFDDEQGAEDEECRGGWIQADDPVDDAAEQQTLADPRRHIADESRDVVRHHVVHLGCPLAVDHRTVGGERVQGLEHGAECGKDADEEEDAEFVLDRGVRGAHVRIDGREEKSYDYRLHKGDGNGQHVAALLLPGPAQEEPKLCRGGCSGTRRV
mmetsp:Transcript_11728/g.33106  ORF Transcript_11728/g.33106 Transcript_11728/m.33106 type:complete len:309 (+) Transcript_11728:2340-3266(+)